MWIYILLGVIQGVFEWIPVSSEGIGALLSQWLIKDFNAIDIALFLHLGTFLAVLVYFLKDWRDVLFLRNRSFLRFLVIGTVISLAVGFLLYNFVTNMAIGPGLLFLTGFGLLITAFLNKKKRIFKVRSNFLAVLVGFLQGLAVIPGLSRSAATIFGLSLGEKRPSEILKVSYMLSAPVVLSSSIFLYSKNPALFYDGWIALIVSFLVGLLGLKVLLSFSQKINFFWFALIFSLVCFIGGIIGLLV